MGGVSWHTALMPYETGRREIILWAEHWLPGRFYWQSAAAHRKVSSASRSSQIIFFWICLLYQHTKNQNSWCLTNSVINTNCNIWVQSSGGPSTEMKAHPVQIQNLCWLENPQQIANDLPPEAKQYCTRPVTAWPIGSSFLPLPFQASSFPPHVNLWLNIQLFGETLTWSVT